MCGSKQTSQSNSSQTYSPPPQVLANYQAVTQQAQGVAATPYQSYGGQLVSPINNQQQTGIASVNNAAGIPVNYNAPAKGLASASASAIDPTQYSSAQLQQYENPYQSDVVNATEAELQNQNQQQAAALTGNNISSGAFGGDRAGVAQAALAGQQDIANNATIAGLNTANFQNAQSEFNNQQQTNLSAQQNTAARQLAASQQLGNLGNTAQTEALNEANAQTNAGTLQQQTQQAQDTAAYNQFLQKQAYPFQTTGWLANIVEGIGSQSGGTSTGTQTTQGGSGASSIVGGLLGLASFLNRGGRVNGNEIRVPHKASGGGLAAAPYDDMITNGLGGGSYVPTENLPIGHTMPTGQSGGAGGAGGQVNSTNAMQGAEKATQGLGTALGNTSIGDSISDFTQDLPDMLGFAKGGLVSRRGYDDGGIVDPLELSPESLLASAPTNPSLATTPLATAPDTSAYGTIPDTFSTPPATGLAAQYANQMPAPQAPVYSGSQAPLDNSLTYDPNSINGSVQALAARADLVKAMGAGSTYASAYNQMPQPTVGNGIAPDVPLPPTRPADLGVDTSATLASAPTTTTGGLATAPGAVGAGVASSPSGNIWKAPAYKGPAWTGAAPDPSSYPVSQQGQAQFIHDYAIYKNIDPNFALSVAKAEGLNAVTPKNPNGASSVDIDPKTGKPFSFGPFQLNVRNGLGTAAIAAGIDPRDPAQSNAANKFALDQMASGGLRPWRGDAAVVAYQGSGAVPNGGTGLASASGTSEADMPSAGASNAQQTGQQEGGGLLGGLFHLSDAQRQGMLAAGLGMMGGQSMNPWINIGQGGLAGINAYNKARELQGSLGLQGAQTLEHLTETQGKDIENRIKQKQLEMMMGVLNGHEQVGNQKADAVAASTNGNGVTTPTVTAPTVAGTTPAANAPAPKTILPQYDPDRLNAEADQMAMVPGWQEAAKIKKDQAAAILSGNQLVKFNDGSVGYYPGASDAKAAQAGAVTTAEEAAKVPAAIKTQTALKNYEQQSKFKNDAASEAETGQQMLSQALGMRNLMFDPKTGQAAINSGPYGEHIANLAATMKQFGFSDHIIQALTQTDPNNAQALEKLRTSLGSESARADLAGSQVRVGEFQRYLASVPNAQLLPAAYKYIIDKVIVPKAQQQIQEYEAVKNLDPQKDDIRGTLFDYRQNHPWYAGAPPADANDRVAGVIYSNASGKRAKWTGTGWVPVQ